MEFKGSGLSLGDGDRGAVGWAGVSFGWIVGGNALDVGHGQIPGDAIRVGIHRLSVAGFEGDDGVIAIILVVLCSGIGGRLLFVGGVDGEIEIGSRGVADTQINYAGSPCNTDVEVIAGIFR